ncbi:hypothetical protein ACOME3_007713 [Neoechinorhynchus agilis]
MDLDTGRLNALLEEAPLMLGRLTVPNKSQQSEKIKSQVCSRIFKILENRDFYDNSIKPLTLSKILPALYKAQRNTLNRDTVIRLLQILSKCAIFETDSHDEQLHQSIISCISDLLSDTDKNDLRFLRLSNVPMTGQLIHYSLQNSLDTKKRSPNERKEHLSNLRNLLSEKNFISDHAITVASFLPGVASLILNTINSPVLSKQEVRMGLDIVRSLLDVCCRNEIEGFKIPKCSDVHIISFLDVLKDFERWTEMVDVNLAKIIHKAFQDCNKAGKNNLRKLIATIVCNSKLRESAHKIIRYVYEICPETGMGLNDWYPFDEICSLIFKTNPINNDIERLLKSLKGYLSHSRAGNIPLLVGTLKHICGRDKIPTRSSLVTKGENHQTWVLLCELMSQLDSIDLRELLNHLIDPFYDPTCHLKSLILIDAAVHGCKRNDDFAQIYNMLSDSLDALLTLDIDEIKAQNRMEFFYDSVSFMVHSLEPLTEPDAYPPTIPKSLFNFLSAIAYSDEVLSDIGINAIKHLILKCGRKTGETIGSA